MTAKLCPRCGAEFGCSPGPQCWCAKLPPIMPMTGGGCLCPRCLGEQIAAQIAKRRAAEARD